MKRFHAVSRLAEKNKAKCLLCLRGEKREKRSISRTTRHLYILTSYSFLVTLVLYTQNLGKSEVLKREKKGNPMMNLWQELNERQQQYLVAIYEVDQEQEKDERSGWSRGEHPRPAREWRWIEYGIFYGEYSSLKMKLASLHLLDEGTGSTFEALERRGLIDCWYTQKRRNGEEIGESFLATQMTAKGRKLVRQALGVPREKPLPKGQLREWHWKAMGALWRNRPNGLPDAGHGWYGNISAKTWQRLKDYQTAALVETYKTWKQVEYQSSGHTWDESQPIYWIRLTTFGETYYRDNWRFYHDLYPEVDAPHPTEPEQVDAPHWPQADVSQKPKEIGRHQRESKHPGGRPRKNRVRVNVKLTPTLKRLTEGIDRSQLIITLLNDHFCLQE